jgi:hypothetical protein
VKTNGSELPDALRVLTDRGIPLTWDGERELLMVYKDALKQSSKSNGGGRKLREYQAWLHEVGFRSSNVSLSFYLTSKDLEKAGVKCVDGNLSFAVEKEEDLRSVLADHFEFDELNDASYLGEYVPKHTGAQDEFSERILDLKKKRRDAVDYFADLLSPLGSANCVVVRVPGHDPSKTTGVEMRADELERRYGLENASPCLIRVKKVESQKFNHDKDVGKIMKSLTLRNPSRLEGRDVLLLDDVATSWTTMMASLSVINGSDPRDVLQFALGRTDGD